MKRDFLRNPAPDVANIIKDLRAKAGLTQPQLSQRLGISTRAVASYEGEDRQPPPRILQALADVAGSLGQEELRERFEDAVRQSLAGREHQPVTDPERAIVRGVLLLARNAALASEITDGITHSLAGLLKHSPAQLRADIESAVRDIRFHAGSAAVKVDMLIEEAIAQGVSREDAIGSIALSQPALYSAYIDEKGKQIKRLRKGASRR